jgi:hypothetical protein
MCCQPHPTARIRPFASCGKTISEVYQEAKKLREGAACLRLVAVQGVE